MRLQHLALFRGIGLDACATNLGCRMPLACLAMVASLCDHHTVTVEVDPDFPLRLPNVALRQNRFLCFVNLGKSEDP